MKQTGQKGGPRTLKTVTTASRVLDAVKDCDGIGVSELSDYLDISKSTAYIHLRTLEENGLLVQRGNRYRFAFKFTVLGEYARNQSPLYRYGKPEVEKLAAETDQYTHIVTEENGYGVNLYQVKGDTSVDGEYQTEKVQSQDHLHYTASGKAILAALPDERVEEIIEQRGLPAQTKATITDREALFDELEQIRERGYAYNDEEEIRGFRAIGAPIEDPSGRVLGSVSVSGPTSLLQGEQFQEHVPKLVTQSANVIEVNINMNTKS
ncbi:MULTISPECIES: IclR family transcriptional regulator [unclassified Haloferax]|uniref:IclR family transcriptional regulator n=1 Tax=unclassified Haloferax TaxID=2625095 RepID=UPI0002AFA6DC|nr:MULTISPECIES: IclR family transcriptional regulator [unclassified Haloferax]ELZ61175.1 ArcR family transcription regulator [Haloferax sp. ATCC BAA-645]ELZ61770.1 ArcR family transcription regulator [Haloferax sp. ATCC BAA-646]ELZ71526.1 ArcR family transcription regulator [Haloferax sp. ATCC BAA-644]